MTVHIWEIRNPDGGSMGLEVARGRMEPHADVLAHALPERVDIEVYDEDRNLVARGTELPGELASPIARLWIRGTAVERLGELCRGGAEVDGGKNDNQRRDEHQVVED